MRLDLSDRETGQLFCGSGPAGQRPQNQEHYDRGDRQDDGPPRPGLRQRYAKLQFDILDMML